MFVLIIEENMEHHLPRGFFEECSKRGINCRFHAYIPHHDQPSCFPSNEQLVGVWGSIRFVRETNKWLKGRDWFSSFPSCLHFYHKYQHLVPDVIKLNTKNMMLPFASLKECDFAWLQGLAGSSGNVFLRPDQALKVCEAESVSERNWSDWLSYTGRYTGVSDTSLFWLSKALDEEILCEYRCLVESGKVRSISSYGFKIEPKNEDLDTELHRSASELASLIKLDEQAYIMDIAKTKEGFKVVELNALSTSGAYELNAASLASCWLALFESEQKARCGAFD